GALPLHTLNVAGPSEGAAPGIGEKSYNLLVSVFSQVAKLDHSPKGGDHTGDAEEGLRMEPLPWWIGIPTSIIRYFRITKYNVLTYNLIILIIIILLLLTTIKLFGFRVVAGQVYLGSAAPVFGAHATVDATAGFQNSGIRLRKGQ